MLEEADKAWVWELFARMAKFVGARMPKAPRDAERRSQGSCQPQWHQPLPTAGVAAAAAPSMGLVLHGVWVQPGRLAPRKLLRDGCIVVHIAGTDTHGS